MRRNRMTEREVSRFLARAEVLESILDVAFFAKNSSSEKALSAKLPRNDNELGAMSHSDFMLLLREAMKIASEERERWEEIEKALEKGKRRL